MASSDEDSNGIELQTVSSSEPDKQKVTCSANERDGSRIQLQKRVCTRFVPYTQTVLLTQNTYCCCGRKMGYHSATALRRNWKSMASRQSWQLETDTRTEPTDACGVYSPPEGDVNYSTHYARVDYTADMTKLLSFMHSEWQMGPVHFLVTLIGSTSPVYLRKRMRSSVQRALARLIETCNELGGWLLTNGAGVTEQVSAALNEQLQMEHEALHVIAIQPWGTLRYSTRKALIEQSAHDDGPPPVNMKDVEERSFSDIGSDSFDGSNLVQARTIGHTGTSPNILDDTDAACNAAVASSRFSSSQPPADVLARESRLPMGVSSTRASDPPIVRQTGAAASGNDPKFARRFSGSVNKRVWLDTSETNRLHQLPPNYPFVLLVDSGQLGSAACGTENGFRQRLEQHLAVQHCYDLPQVRQIIAPACYVLFAGGPRSTRQVQYALARQIPVVVLQGTGKMADILALACSKADEEDLDPMFVRQNGLPDRLRVYFRQAIKERVEVKDEPTLNEILSDVERCMWHHHLISVYQINSADCDLDVRVLRAMLSIRERPKFCEVEPAILLRNINSGAAEPEPRVEEVLPINVSELMCNALLHNHIDCVRMVLGRTKLSLKTFLTVDRLSALYVPERLKASTFKSLLIDRRLRDASWLNARQGRTATAVAEANIHELDAEYDTTDQHSTLLKSSPLRRKRPNHVADLDFSYCPLTLAGKVITRILGSYFHSSFLHYGHHIEDHPQAILALGQFKVVPKAKGSGCHPQQSDDRPDGQVRFSASGGQTHAATQPADSPSAVVIGTRRKTASAHHPKRRRRVTSFTRRAKGHIDLTSLECSGDHTELVRLHVDEDAAYMSSEDLADSGKAGDKHVAGGHVAKGSREDVQPADCCGPGPLPHQDSERKLASKRVIASQFLFVHTNECAALHLFVWCVLQMRIELAMLFWQRTNHKMAAAFIARLILHGLLKAEKSVEMKERMRQEMDKFERLALGILNLAFELDVRRTEYLLLVRLDDVVAMSTIQLAARADCKNFIAHPACTNLLDDVWCGSLSPRNGWLRILLCVALPFLVPFLIVFRTKPPVHKALRCGYPARNRKVSTDAADYLDLAASTRYSNASMTYVGWMAAGIEREREREQLPDADEAHYTFYKRMKTTAEARKRKRAVCNSNQEYSETDARGAAAVKHSNCQGCICCAPCCETCGKAFSCILAFFTAPKTIFAANTMFYVAFLMVFSYMMLFAFNSRSFNILEWLVALCMVAMTGEELRQFLLDQGGGFRSRVRVYFSSVWNVFDFACLACFYLGFAAAASPFNLCNLCMELGRILVTVSLMILYLRLLNIFSVHQVLGPKLVMLGQMIKNVFDIFIMIGIFVLAYGVAAQSILYPNVGEHDVVSVIRNATIRGYFAMFGDLGLEEINSATPCDSLSKLTNASLALALPFTIENVTSGAESSATASSGTTEIDPALYCTNDVAQYTVPVLLAVHVVMTNLVLFNVLIAIFNFIFNKIDDQTDEHWRYNMYCLIEEYRAKPPLTPPLVIIWHVLLLIYILLENMPCCGLIRRTNWFGAVRKRFGVPPFCCEHVEGEIREDLTHFEDQVTSRYVKEQEEAKLSETEARLSQIDNAVKEANTLLAAVHDVVIATDYNTELLKKRDRNQASLDAIESYRKKSDLQKMVNEALDARLRPFENKLNVLLNALTELKSSPAQS